MPVPTAPKCRIAVQSGARYGFLKIGGVRTDQKRQFSRGGRFRQAGHRAIDIDEAAAAQLMRQIERVTIGNGGAFDRQRAGFHRRSRAVLCEPHRARSLVIGDHGDDGIGIDRGILRRRRPLRAAGNQIFRLRLAAIPDRDLEAGVEIAAGHAVAHATETDEGNSCHE